ncbi:hypothetical protein [Chroogloeocystis siderophila]|jgi:hypothetical protein|uniref:Uncharacterized protein n=1 Tax=Chroogloeocystis siderophila 5.2 s.c.1 TaxID=247279 RepID=A0A1U7HB99_9CHRO|nr:hypothetical protein [Chroogloeocystis siderophila]OKH20867.1 hypothetical protein NIES1031_22645 [Chroogloeocystis siderophila 5.2 s.c.1]
MHLNINFDVDKCQDIASLFTLEQQKERIQKFTTQLMQTSLNLHNHREIVDYHDEDSLLHINHINAAKTGVWQEYLSTEEVTKIENKVKSWCNNNKHEYLIFLRQIYLKENYASTHATYSHYRFPR